MEWKYAPGDVVELRSGGACAIATRERAREKGQVVPVYEALAVGADRWVRGPVRLIREADVVGKLRREPDRY